MKKSYHLCLSAGNEVMFRDEEDFNRGFNCFALSLYKTDSVGLVETFMSNHFHLLIQTSRPDEFMYLMRQSYSKYFNNKYIRSGKLGEEYHYEIDIVGLHHHLAAMSYVLRNALHHGVAPIPYAYPHSSVNAIFQKEMGKLPTNDLLPSKSYYRYIGRRTTYPSHYKMNKDGLFLRESVLDIAQVENMFVTPRAFDYYMCRKTSEDWMKEQSKDGENSLPIRLEDIEKGVNLQSIDRMLVLENGKSDYRKISDLALCKDIDRMVFENYQKRSVYLLTTREKQQIANYLYMKHYASESQLRRCLVF